jgi:2-polyprenyl-3-methyl-5-hydroxy-6-metoxy-1,4-benzoquinol methylase
MGRYITTTLTYATTTVETGVSYTASVNDRVLCTAGSITITLPISSGLNVGDTVQVIDVGGNAGNANITVARNGANIQGSATDLTIDINNASPVLVYSGVTYGWVISGS